MADVLWTDPPYGVRYQGGTRDKLRISNDDGDPDATRELLARALILAPLRPGAVFYIATPSGSLHIEFLLAIRAAGLGIRQTIVWVKDRFVLSHGDFHYRHEAIVTGASPDEEGLGPHEYEPIVYGWTPGAAHMFNGDRRQDTVWEIPKPTSSREHPTMKPVELVARSLELSSSAGGIVFDPFVGSGTTIIASEQLGRRCLAIEIEPRYAQVTIERWQAFTGQTAERLDG